jgi:hypothetical protein
VTDLTDTIAAAAANAFTEGAAATDQTLTVPVRVASHVQNLQKHFWVSKRDQAVRHAGLANMVSYQEMKKTKEILRDLELALHRGSAVTGNSGVAGTFSGLLNGITTYATSSSGTTLTERVFNDLVTLSYATPSNLREVYANMQVKRTINGFTTRTQRYIPATERRQVDIIEVYESEVGLLGIFKSRDQLQAASIGAQGNSFCVIDPDYWTVGWLRPFNTLELGLDGDRDRRMIVGEVTLIRRNELAGVAGTGYVANIA